MPYALAKSIQQTASDLCMLRASLKIAANLAWCSMHPDVLFMNAFWSDQGTQWFLRMAVKTLPIAMQDVKYWPEVRRLVRILH